MALISPWLRQCGLSIQAISHPGALPRSSGTVRRPRWLSSGTHPLDARPKVWTRRRCSSCPLATTAAAYASNQMQSVLCRARSCWDIGAAQS